MATYQDWVSGGAESIQDRREELKRELDTRGFQRLVGVYCPWKAKTDGEKILDLLEWNRKGHHRPLVANQNIGRLNPEQIKQLKRFIPHEARCNTWVNYHLKAAYRKAGKLGKWQEMDAIKLRVGSDRESLLGNPCQLAAEQRNHDWKTIYIVMEASSAPPDREKVLKKGVYSWPGSSGLEVDLIFADGMAASESVVPILDIRTGLAKLRKVGFWWWTQDFGNHSCAGLDGYGRMYPPAMGPYITELHVERLPNDPNLVTCMEMERYIKYWQGLVRRGRGGRKYCTGIIMLPPGALDLLK